MNRGLSLVLSVLCLLFPAAAAHAHGGGIPRGAQDTSFDAHSRDHQALDRAIRNAQEEWQALTPTQQQDRLEDEAAEQRSLELATGEPEEDGQWDPAPPFPISTFAIHMVLLPTGKVMYWGYPPVEAGRPNHGRAGIWDPDTGVDRALTLPEVDLQNDGTPDPIPIPIYCSGQSMLPTGEVLIAGGNLRFEDEDESFAGLKEVFTFDPFNESWIQQPSMNRGRWYPTQTELADGRTVILGGTDEQGPVAQMNNELEIFTPSPQRGGVGQVTRIEGSDRPSELYPIGFLQPDGNVLTGAPSGPGVLNTGSNTWSDLDAHIHNRRGGSAVLVPEGPEGATDVMLMGGAAGDPDIDGVVHAEASSEILDTQAPGGGWQPGPSYDVSRSQANVVQLPDGSMVAVGGGAGSSPESGNYLTDAAGERRQVELFDPDSGTWRLGPPQEEDRTYHSTAVLLPDGRVLSAGDDFHPSEDDWYSRTDTAEIYSPPYLFRGPRPAIQSAPEELGYGEPFTVETTGGASSAVLMAPGATTHAFDMQQRNVPLQRTGGSGGELALNSPGSGAIAPPGYYMLFVLDSDGVPSEARWVHLEGPYVPKPEEEKPVEDVKGPAVSVKVIRSGGGGASLRALVTSDEAATVKVRIKLRALGRKAGGRSASLKFGAAGKQQLTMFVKGRSQTGLRATVTVDARDPKGNASAWTRKLRVAP